MATTEAAVWSLGVMIGPGWAAVGFETDSKTERSRGIDQLIIHVIVNVYYFRYLLFLHGNFYGNFFAVQCVTSDGPLNWIPGLNTTITLRSECEVRCVCQTKSLLLVHYYYY